MWYIALTHEWECLNTRNQSLYNTTHDFNTQGQRQNVQQQQIIGNFTFSTQNVCLDAALKRQLGQGLNHNGASNQIYLRHRSEPMVHAYYHQPKQLHQYLRCSNPHLVMLTTTYSCTNGSNQVFKISSRNPASIRFPCNSDRYLSVQQKTILLQLCSFHGFSKCHFINSVMPTCVNNTLARA